MTGAALTRWHGEYRLEVDRWGHLRLGPLDLWIRRRKHEWRLAYSHGEDTLEERLELDFPSPGEEPPELDEILRFAQAETHERIALLPATADRPIVTRPEHPFHLLAGESVEIFVSTPVWLRIEVGDPARRLLEIPTHRPSDTWFGPSTRFGELCYSSRTSARLGLERLPSRSHRAITRVRLTNRAPDAVLLERLSLPVPHLGLFWREGKGLWTQGVEVTRHADGTLAEVRLEGGPPPEAAGAERVAEPRETSDRKLLVRALGALLG